MNHNKIKRIIIIFTTIIFLVVTFFVSFFLFKTYQDIKVLESADTYEIDGDSIKSLGLIVGKRRIFDLLAQENEKVITRQYFYDQVDSREIDLVAYEKYLFIEGFSRVGKVNFDQNTGSVKYVARSLEDPRKIILLTISWDEKVYSIKIQKGTADIGTVEAGS